LEKFRLIIIKEIIDSSEEKRLKNIKKCISSFQNDMVW